MMWSIRVLLVLHFALIFQEFLGCIKGKTAKVHLFAASSGCVCWEPSLGGFVLSVKVAEEGFIPQIWTEQNPLVCREGKGPELVSPQECPWSPGTGIKTKAWLDAHLGELFQLQEFQKGRNKKQKSIWTHFHPAQSCSPQIQGHPGCSDAFIKHTPRFVRVNLNAPVWKKKSVVFSCCAVRESC